MARCRQTTIMPNAPQQSSYRPYIAYNSGSIFPLVNRPGDRDRDRGYRGDRDRDMNRGGGGAVSGRDMRDDRDRRENVRPYDQRDRDQIPIEERMPKLQESTGPVSTTDRSD